MSKKMFDGHYHMNTTKLVTAIILAVIYTVTFLFFVVVTVVVNKKSDKMDKSINLMLLCLMIASLCKFPSLLF